MSSHTFHPSVLRAYDIRGVVGETIFPEDAHAIGRCFADYVREKGGKCVALAWDGRLSSPTLQQAVQDGLLAGGVDVVSLGQGPTPLLYYAIKSLPDVDAGLMVTGSHNPPTHNGFKMATQTRPLLGDEIQDFARRVQNLPTNLPHGTARSLDLKEAYVERVLKGLHLSAKTVVWDPGNGAMAVILPILLKHLPGKHIVLNGALDGTFPSHHPDPVVEHNLTQLKEVVLAENADLGIAFDGDGDRLGVVDNQGRMIPMDLLVLLMAEDVLKRSPGATIISEVKASQYLYDRIQALGGNPIMWRTGHSYIKMKMQEVGAKLAGEMSGHLFFADDYYGYDDGLYAALRVLQLVCQTGPLSHKIDQYPKLYTSSEDINCDDAEKFLVIERLAQIMQNSGKELCTIDGVRVKEEGLGWWLIRASNTQPKLVCCAEGNSAEALEKVLEEMHTVLKKAL